jgi:hypothetical protein
MNRLPRIERPNIADYVHDERTDRHILRCRRAQAYRNIVGAWRILAGIEPFEPFCLSEKEKLIEAYPADKLLIEGIVKEVWG